MSDKSVSHESSCCAVARKLGGKRCPICRKPVSACKGDIMTDIRTSFVLNDAARMLRAAARLLDKAAVADTEGKAGAYVRQAHTNVNAAVARMPTVAETKG